MRTAPEGRIIAAMAGAPARFTDAAADRVARLDSRFEELEKDLLDASARRIHDFERRLEHEWIALRQLHEEPLKTIEQRTAAISESCLNLVTEALAVMHSQSLRDAGASSTLDQPSPAIEPAAGPSRNTIAGLAVAVGALIALSAYAFWSVNGELRDARVRTAAAEDRLTRLQQRVDGETREAGRLAQRLTADAIASGTRAERLANVLAAPDVRMYRMRGQRTAAAAGGQTFFSASRGVALSASSLPPLSPKQTYQVWLVTSDGSIALGFAAPDAQGRLSAAFDVPPSVSGTVVGFMLSLEPTGGSPKPAGPIVLAS